MKTNKYVESEKYFVSHIIISMMKPLHYVKLKLSIYQNAMLSIHEMKRAENGGLGLLLAIKTNSYFFIKKKV